ncbi:hypothetical protein DM02DRAFT_694976 [Periconia macrospinosa]|uniref:Rhodopsin domain-containing protein n=1 Tax=Periconia macrospinosa TaxID=97972 RepID=A0A2V1E002_9PLEO|nr:hypothetical protein DM02DRAFT_694976 [Periconia macrospinosa]
MRASLKDFHEEVEHDSSHILPRFSHSVHCFIVIDRHICSEPRVDMPATMEPVPSMLTTAVVVISVLFPLLSLFSIYLRWKARSTSKHQWSFDDWWIVVTFFATVGISINAWVFASSIGINFVKVDPLTGSSRSALCLFTGTLFLQPALAAVKISILLFYRRIFRIRPFTTACWVMIGAVSIWAVLFEILVVFQGNPVSASWTGKGTFNFDVVSFGLAQGGTSLALDVLILTFPLPMIWNLHLQRRCKIAVGIIFWLGGFCCVAAIVRLVLLIQVLHTTVSSAQEGYNLLYIQSKAYIFTIVEPNCSIIAACLPCYGPLARPWGGRAPESLVQSVRSVLSLGSRQNSNNSGASRSQTGAGRSIAAKPRSESYIELTEREGSNRDGEADHSWEPHEGQGYGGVTVERPVEGTPVLGEGIGVTRTFGAH